MVKFVVRGPIDVPVKKGARGEPYIDDERLRALCDDYPDLNKPGCYVFACQSARGSLPIYVGQASGGIFAEAFNHRNRYNLSNYFRRRLRGVLQLYIIPQVNVRGSQGSGAISDIEEFLIATASRRNPNLINIHGTRRERWSIAGVRNHRQGHPGLSVIAFKKMMGMETRAAAANGQIRPVAPSDNHDETELPADAVLDTTLEPEDTKAVEGSAAEAAVIDMSARLGFLARVYHRVRLRKSADG